MKHLTHDAAGQAQAERDGIPFFYAACGDVVSVDDLVADPERCEHQACLDAVGYSATSRRPSMAVEPVAAEDDGVEAPDPSTADLGVDPGSMVGIVRFMLSQLLEGVELTAEEISKLQAFTVSPDIEGAPAVQPLAIELEDSEDDVRRHIAAEDLNRLMMLAQSGDKIGAELLVYWILRLLYGLASKVHHLEAERDDFFARLQAAGVDPQWDPGGEQEDGEGGEGGEEGEVGDGTGVSELSAPDNGAAGASSVMGASTATPAESELPR